RRRLLPCSDLDLLLLTEDRGEAVRKAARELLYPLWDAGLKVGHQVRTRREHLRACRHDLETLTASLTGRAAAGDAGYASAVLASVAAEARRRRSSLLRELASRPRAGSPYLLEPDLKEGPGGQRDLDEMAWTAAILLGRPSEGLEALVEAGLASAEDVAELREAGAAICAARWRLQRLGGGAVMTAEEAEGLGQAADRVQAALPVADDALRAVRSAAAGSALRALPPASRLQPAPDAQALLAAVQAGRAEEVECWARRGHLDILVPGLRPLMTLRRPGLSHTLTVGAHCVAAACALPALAGADRLLARSACEAGDLAPALLAALTHDAGKAQSGPGHPARGAPAAERAARACGLTAHEAAFAARLVREHLLLPEAALRTDPGDARAVAALAARIPGERTLAALHLLAAADAAATGPGAWTAWHAVLLAGLVAAVRASLAEHAPREPGEVPRDALGEEPPGRGGSWLAAATPRYLASRSPEAAAADARLVAGLLAAGSGAPPVLGVHPGPVKGSWNVDVAAHDRHGLFADVAGVFALAGLDVLSAAAHGWGGVAIDSFTVRSATLATPGPDTWAKVERLLGAVTRDRLSLDARLEERRRHYPSPPSASPAPSVRFDASDPAHTLVEIEAGDRVGLLHDLAAALSDAGLDVAWANALVQDGVAQDVFRVSSADGSHREPGVLGHVSMRVRERLAGR
ncbi:MAG: hypothetical protein IBX62_04870, partial [Coriobacteriia bacterium]|nr:hypothetical protein [Coriobacteriia bacterium]